MITIKHPAFTMLVGSLALVSCQTVQAVKSEPQAIGKILSANSDAKICREGDCIAAEGQTININDVLRSGSLNMTLQLFGVNGAITSHKLLGTTDSWEREGEVIKVRHVDGTLSGEVVNQPVRIQFGPSHNEPNRIAYCEFSTGQYRAINYGIFRLEIQNGTAVCIDTKGNQQIIADGAFED